MKRLLWIFTLPFLWACDPVVGAECAAETTPCGTLCCAPGFLCEEEGLCVSDPALRPDAGEVDGAFADAGMDASTDLGGPDMGAEDMGAADARSLMFPRPPIDPGTVINIPRFDLDGGVDPSDGGDVGPNDMGPADGSPDGGPNDGGANDGGPSDTGPADGSPDGGPVDGSPDGGPTDMGSADGGPDAGDAGTPDAGSCPIGTQDCNGNCVDTTLSTQHCGGCNMPCGLNEICNAGVCDLSCTAPVIECANACVNTESNAQHCGACNSPCTSGICFNSACVAASGGHVVVLGYDFGVRQPGVFRLAGNSALLPVSSPVRSAVFIEQTPPALVAAINSAISTTAIEQGRTWAPQTVAAADVTQQLAQVDSFLIYPQDNATDVQLQGWSTQWSTALTDFVRRGGTIVVFDAGGAHSGNWQVLDDAGLFTATARTAVASGTLLEVSNGADAVTLGVPLTFPARGSTNVFVSPSTDDVVTTQSMPPEPAVFHGFIRP